MLRLKPKIRSKKSDNLTLKQELFCELYTTDKQCFGNATIAYRTAYGMTQSQYRSAQVSAHHLLRESKIKAYINKLLDSSFNEKTTDLQLALVIMQNKDLPSKVAAIREYNKLRQRITEKTDITSAGQSIKGINYIVPEKTFS